MKSFSLLRAQLLLPALVAAAPVVTCGRKSLSLASQNFFYGAAAKSDPLKPSGLELASNVKISQDNKVLSSLKDSIYTNLTGFASGYQIEVADTVNCDIATLVVLSQGTEPVIVSLRMRTEHKKEGAKITEVEILTAGKGSHALFAPQNYPEDVPAVWQDHLNDSADKGPKPKIRTDLINIVNTYPEAMQKGDNTMALAAADCPRVENGNQTTTHCGQNMDLFKWPVTDRRWVVDTRTDVVMGSFFFHYKDGKGKMSTSGGKDRGPDSKVGLWLHEYFKVDNGKIVAISAAMKTLGADYKDVWAGK